MRRQADKLEEEMVGLQVEAASLQEDSELPLALKAGGELSGFAVQIRNAAFGYGADAPTLFRGVELGVCVRTASNPCRCVVALLLVKTSVVVARAAED